MEMGMEEPYPKGVANDGGPEPCLGDPRGAAKRWTGYAQASYQPRTGESGSRRRHAGGRQHRWRRYARVAGLPGEVGEPVMCGFFMRENRERRLPSHRERCGPLGEG